MKYAIWDLDNCISDDSPRLHLIDKSKQGDERYYDYNCAMMNDRLANVAKYELIRDMGAKPVFFTGRCEDFRGLTHSWLTRVLDLPSPWVFMRPSGTVGLTAANLKQQMLTNFLATCADQDMILGAFDDLEPVVDMYRRNGIPAAVVRVYDPALAYGPADLARSAA